ncbi:MAG: cytochrome b/b6 domain-containing protein, partial [Pseudomonadota bacterium]
MRWRNDGARWGAVAKLLHWSMAALMIYGALLAVYLVNQDPDVEANRLRYINWITVHKSVGLTVFALVFLRLIWLRLNPRPETAGHASRGERLASHLAHGSLYALMIVLPVIGFFSSNSVGATTHFW